MSARTGLIALLVIGVLVLGAVLVMRMGSHQKLPEQPAVAAEPAPEPIPPPVAALAKQPAPVAGQAPQLHARLEEAATAGVIAAAPVAKEPPVKAAPSVAEPAPVAATSASVEKPVTPAAVAEPSVEAPTVVVEQIEVVDVPVEVAPPAMIAASAAPPAGDTSGGESTAGTGRQTEERAPGDLILDKKTRATGFDPVLFPHWRHRIHFRCYVCHTQVFEMKRGASEITMATIDQGKFCGKCHNGKVAFNVEFQNCARCHKPLVAAR